MVYWNGIVACLIVALNCFSNDGRQLDLPHWAWCIVGVFWIVNAIALLMKWIGS